MFFLDFPRTVAYQGSHKEEELCRLERERRVVKKAAKRAVRRKARSIRFRASAARHDTIGEPRGACVLLKADAFELPLRAGSMKLVIATPPHLGVRRLGRSGFYTSDWYEYRDLLAAVQRQCLRVL